MDFLFCNSCSADGGGGRGGNAGSPKVPNFRKSNGCMLCSRLSGDTVRWESRLLGGEFALLVTPAAEFPPDEDE